MPVNGHFLNPVVKYKYMYKFLIKTFCVLTAVAVLCPCVLKKDVFFNSNKRNESLEYRVDSLSPGLITKKGALPLVMQWLARLFNAERSAPRPLPGAAEEKPELKKPDTATAVQPPVAQDALQDLHALLDMEETVRAMLTSKKGRLPASCKARFFLYKDGCEVNVHVDVIYLLEHMEEISRIIEVQKNPRPANGQDKKWRLCLNSHKYSRHIFEVILLYYRTVQKEFHIPWIDEADSGGTKAVKALLCAIGSGSVFDLEAKTAADSAKAGKRSYFIIHGLDRFIGPYARPVLQLETYLEIAAAVQYSGLFNAMNWTVVSYNPSAPANSIPWKTAAGLTETSSRFQKTNKQTSDRIAASLAQAGLSAFNRPCADSA